MNGQDNLRPVTNSEEAKKRGAAGGRKSGISRRKKRDIKRCLEMLLEKDMTTRNGETVSGAEAISAKLFESALKGDVRAFEVLRDTVGQKPVDKVEHKNTNIVIDLGNLDDQD